MARVPSHRLLHGLAFVSLAACVPDDVTDEPSREDMFEIEPGMWVSLKPFDSKADLPNGIVTPRLLDTNGYRAIANRFIASGFDVRLTHQGASYEWPLKDSRSVLSREGTPIRLGTEVYEHTGLDVIRKDEIESPAVYAPTTGKAMITDWWGNFAFPSGDYSTVVAIWDPTTHHILQLMHVKSDPALPKDGSIFDVTRGQLLGELADVGIAGGNHTHVNVIDGEHHELIDPVSVMPSYLDTTVPVLHDVYVLDAEARKHTTLQTGPLDFVVTASDRDDQSPRNLEVESLAYTIRDANGTELSSLRRCHLQDAYKMLATSWETASSTVRLIDFGNAVDQFGGFWPNADLGNPDRKFRYALTNMKVDASGVCSIVANDRDGQVEIADTVPSVTITVDVWDSRGNQSSTAVTLVRSSPQGGQGVIGRVDTGGLPLGIRADASTTSTVVGNIADTTQVTVTCQKHGESMTGTYGTSTLWDQIGGGFVPDVFVFTGSNGQVAPLCP
jgi:hypothetical protein